MVDPEQIAYAYFTILGIDHPEIEEWKSAALINNYRLEMMSKLKEMIYLYAEVGRNIKNAVELR